MTSQLAPRNDSRRRPFATRCVVELRHDGRETIDLFAFLTTKPNAEVEAVIRRLCR